MAPAEKYQGNERRVAQRYRVLKSGRLRFNKGYGAFECVVRNRSHTGGALLVFGETAAVPAHFELEINGDDARRMATVRWRTVTTLGVAFDA